MSSQIQLEPVWAYSSITFIDTTEVNQKVELQLKRFTSVYYPLDKASSNYVNVSLKTEHKCELAPSKDL